MDYPPSRRKGIINAQTATNVAIRIGHSLLTAADVLPMNAAAVAFEKLGVWPISFSYPSCSLRLARSRETKKVRVLSDVIPGASYSFESYASYLRQYSEAEFALTFKKGGWDCFRHLEIIAAGTIPLMLDGHKIPDSTMVHYPKQTIQRIMEAIRLGKVGELDAVQAYLNQWFDDHLSAPKMAEYILKVADRRGPVLFLDQGLGNRPDYMSASIFSGLKDLLGQKVESFYGAGPLFAGWTGDTSHLHGLGFGYTRVISDSVATEVDLNQSMLGYPSRELLREVARDGLVVVADVARNHALSEYVSAVLESGGAAYIHSSDRPLSRRELTSFRSLSGIKFSREL